MPELQLEQKTNYELVEEQSRLNEIAKELESAQINSPDTEATSLAPHDAKLLLFQIAPPGEAYLFDARHLDLRPFQSILGSEKILKLAQNAKFDYGMLKELAGVEIVNIFDTLLAERILTCGMTKLGDLSLAALSRKYLGIELAKEVRETFFGGHLRDFTKKQLDYAAKDVLVLFGSSFDRRGDPGALRPSAGEASFGVPRVRKNHQRFWGKSSGENQSQNRPHPSGLHADRRRHRKICLFQSDRKSVV